MSRPLLPPRGIFVPTRILYTRELSPSVIHTWAQLRGLAYGQYETPQLSILQLSELTGKSRSTIFGHMALLRSWGALRWRPSVEGTLIVTFPTDSGEFFLDDIDQSSQEESSFLDNPESWNLDLPDPSPSSQPNQIVSIDSEEREDFNPRQGDNQLDPSRGRSVQESGFQSDNHQEQSLVENYSSEDIGEDNWEREINQLDYSRGQSPTKEGGRGVQEIGQQSENPDSPRSDLEGMDGVQKFGQSPSSSKGDGQASAASSAGSQSSSRGSIYKSRNTFSPRDVREGRDSFQEFGLPPELDGADAAKVYQKVTGIRPNQYQRGQMKASVLDTNIWYSAITHWQSHGWNPKNVHGIYDLYQRGGAPGCRYCSKEQDTEDETLSVIRRMREEYRSRNYGNC